MTAPPRATATLAAALVPLLLLIGCGGASGVEGRAAVGASASSNSTTAAPATTPTTTTTSTTSTPTTLPPTTPVPQPAALPASGRVVVDTGYSPFATTGGVTLHHPSARVERVGFHQSNHEGAQQLDPLPTAVDPRTMEARDRLSADRTAADIVSEPGLEIRAPVSGTVIASGSYVLYCKYRDYYLIIEPDDHPGWQVKLLHIADVFVGAGERVEATVTPVASGPHQLPFESQVDAFRTADPAWPHVQLEVIDPSIPNVPNPGSGGC